MCSAVALPALCQTGVTLRFYLDKKASHALAYSMCKSLRDMMKVLLLSWLTRWNEGFSHGSNKRTAKLREYEGALFLVFNFLLKCI